MVSGRTERVREERRHIGTHAVRRVWHHIGQPREIVDHAFVHRRADRHARCLQSIDIHQALVQQHVMLG